MLREEYVTEKNSQNKINQWKEQLFPYSKKWKKLSLKKTIFLVIDMQNYFLDEKSHAFIPTSRYITKNIQKTVAFFRKKKLPVLFTYFAVSKDEDDPIGKWWNDTVYERSAQSKIIKALKPRENELVIRKSTYSAFYKTDLKKILESKNIKNIIISGVLTNLCCETVAREAFVRNFNVFFLMDGTATYNEEMHLSTLKNLSYGFATPITMEDILP